MQYWKWIHIALLITGLLSGCGRSSTPEEQISAKFQTRAEAIPQDANKVIPEEDAYPPMLHSDEWQQPIPVVGPINTAGAEDSPFITPDGSLLTFFFTPDVHQPLEDQLMDGVTGLYLSHWQDGNWTEPEKMILQESGKISLDGCQFLQGNVLWFCSAREGNYRGVDIWRAELIDGKWTNWTNAGERLNLTYEVGEMHITPDGDELYFHSSRNGGKGEYDIWVSRQTEGDWGVPENVEAVNTELNEGWPFITQDGNELWFMRNYQGSPAIYRSLKIEGNWSQPQLILSQFAGEPSLDAIGNIYFVHHFFKDGEMIEADIYVAHRKAP
jgi:hypothetical protein